MQNRTAMEVVGYEHLGGGYGNAGMRPERRLSGRNTAGQLVLSCRSGYSGEKAINPRGMGTESPCQERPFPFIGTEEVVNHRSIEHSWIRHFIPRSSLQ